MAADITIDPVTVEVLDVSATDLGITLRQVTEPVIDLTGGGGEGPGGGSSRPTTGMIYPRGQG